MSFEPREYLRHILAEADYLIGRGSGLSPEAFEAAVTTPHDSKGEAAT